MGQQDKEMDIESLQKSGRRRGSCLDGFLVVSIMFLLVSVTALATGGVMVVKYLDSKLETLRPSVDFESLKQSSETPGSEYKMQNFAYLEALKSKLESSTMALAPVKYAAGNSVGSNFLFDKGQHLLKTKQAGTYFIYVDLNLTCTYKCNAGLLSVQVGDKLICEVDLPEGSAPVSRKCWTVSQLSEGQQLVAQMTLPKEGLENWKLELGSSGFGMFLVD